MKTTRFYNSVCFEVALETFGARRKPLSQGVAGSRMRASLNLERERARASTQQSEQLATYIAKGSSVRWLGCWVTSMKRRTKIVAAFFVRSSVYAPWPYGSSSSPSSDPRLALSRSRPLAFSPRGLVDGGRDASIVPASKRRKIVTAIQHDRSTQEATPDAAHRAWKSKGARWKAIGATEMSSSESRGREKEHCYRRLSRGIDWVRDERDSAVASVSPRVFA